MHLFRVFSIFGFIFKPTVDAMALKTFTVVKDAEEHPHAIEPVHHHFENTNFDYPLKMDVQIFKFKDFTIPSHHQAIITNHNIPDVIYDPQQNKQQDLHAFTSLQNDAFSADSRSMPVVGAKFKKKIDAEIEVKPFSLNYRIKTELTTTPRYPITTTNKIKQAILPNEPITSISPDQTTSNVKSTTRPPYLITTTNKIKQASTTKNSIICISTAPTTIDEQLTTEPYLKQNITIKSQLKQNIITLIKPLNVSNDQILNSSTLKNQVTMKKVMATTSFKESKNSPSKINKTPHLVFLELDPVAHIDFPTGHAKGNIEHEMMKKNLKKTIPILPVTQQSIQQNDVISDKAKSNDEAVTLPLEKSKDNRNKIYQSLMNPKITYIHPLKKDDREGPNQKDQSYSLEGIEPIDYDTIKTLEEIEESFHETDTDHLPNGYLLINNQYYQMK